MGVPRRAQARGCFNALQIRREDCRALAERLSSRASAEAFLSHMALARQSAVPGAKAA
jgi:hypothetical protein